MSQKGNWNAKENIQNLIYIYVLPIKAMTIMASYCFSIHMNVKEFKSKIHLMKFSVLSFDLGPLNVNMNTLDSS
jgi:hypothetical protein